MGSGLLFIAPVRVKCSLSESEKRLKEFGLKLIRERSCEENVTREEILSIAKGRSEYKLQYVTLKARMRGLIKPQPCEVCGMLPNQPRRVHGHHDNYNYPLALRWLCEVHHAIWHGSNEPIRMKQEIVLLKPDEYVELGAWQLRIAALMARRAA